jgi:hypothetical protein
VLNETLSKPMLQGKGAWCMAGGCGMGSFVGFMDEVRLTSRVLAADAFLKFQSRSGLLFNIR